MVVGGGEVGVVMRLMCGILCVFLVLCVFLFLFFACSVCPSSAIDHNIITSDAAPAA